MGCGNGGFDLLGAGFGDPGQDLGRGRVEDGLDAALAGNQLTIDQQCCEQRGWLGASHFTSALFFYWHGALRVGKGPALCSRMETD
ncbi:hypothetical protein D3C80_1231710 [compost metagenome]